MVAPRMKVSVEADRSGILTKCAAVPALRRADKNVPD